MKLITAEDYADMSKKAAEIVLEHVNQSEKLNLGLATGGTPIETYNYLIKNHQENDTSYQHVSTFNLDEYIGIDPSNTNSYHYFMEKHLFQYINIPRSQTNIPNGLAMDLEKECMNYEDKVTKSGGIDLQILGLGTNGHIGFNEPETPFDKKTHVVTLTEATRQANARFFDSIDEVPTHAITMGIDTIMRSKQILLLVSGKKKSEALARLLNGEVSTNFPASILNQHTNVTIVADNDALQLTDTKLFSTTK